MLEKVEIATHIKIKVTVLYYDRMHDTRVTCVMAQQREEKLQINDDIDLLAKTREVLYTYLKQTRS